MEGCRQLNLFTTVSRSIVCALIIVSNSLTIFTMLKSKGHVGKKGRLYIISLSVADLLVAPSLPIDLIIRGLGVTCFYQQQENLLTTDSTSTETYEFYDHSWDALWRRWCFIGLNLFYFISLGGSIFTLLLIAIDRFTAVSFPLFYRNKVTTAKIKVAITVVWIYVVFVIGGLLVTSALQASDEQVLTTIDPANVLPQWYRAYFALPHSYFALVAAGLLYAITVVNMKKSNKKLQQLKKQTQNQMGDNKRTVRFIRMAIATMSTMIILWVPHMITYQSIDTNNPNNPSWLIDYLYTSSYTLLFCNAWVNPLIYCTTNADFRRAYVKALKMGNNSIEPSSNSTN